MRPALILLLALALAGCGARGDPLPVDPEGPAAFPLGPGAASPRDASGGDI